MEQEDLDNSKVYKIKYSINLLPQVGYFVDDNGEHCNEDVSLMSLAAESEEIEIFTTDSLNNLIEFKWVSYGKRHHTIGCVMHFVYTFVFILYVSQACLYEDLDENKTSQKIYAILLLVGIAYPAAYDCTQLIRGGLAEYVSDPYNFADFIYIWGSIANSVLQIFMGPFHLYTRALMCIIVVLLITKTFFFLRIFPTLTPIVVMLTNVIFDLRIFLFFYFILILLFSQLFAVLGLGNAALRTDLSADD